MEMPAEVQHQVMGYDRTATMFSPEGHLLQVEYAEKTVRLGSASIGMVCSDGIAILADKRIKDILMVRSSATKIYEVDSHICTTAAGILSDARMLVERAQLMAQQHRVTYDTAIDTETVIKDIANVEQQYSQYGGARPFGVSIMVAGVNTDSSAKLFVSDVTGNYVGYHATAIGENDERLKELLREKYKENITIEQGIKLALEIFKKLLGKNFDLGRFDAAYINKKDKKLIRMSEDDLKKFNKEGK